MEESLIVQLERLVNSRALDIKDPVQQGILNELHGIKVALAAIALNGGTQAEEGVPAYNKDLDVAHGSLAQGKVTEPAGESTGAPEPVVNDGQLGSGEETVDGEQESEENTDSTVDEPDED